MNCDAVHGMEKSNCLIIHNKKQLNYQSAWYKLLHIEDEAPKVMNVKAAFDTSKFNQAAVAQNVLAEIKKKGFKYFVIMQFTGGQSPLVQVPPKTAENGQQVPDWSKVQYNYENEPLKRHYPIEKAQEFVDKFVTEYPETAIILYQLPNLYSIFSQKMVDLLHKNQMF